MDGTAFSTRFFGRPRDVRVRIVKPSYAIAILTVILSVVQCGTRTASNARIQGNDDEPPELEQVHDLSVAKATLCFARVNIHRPLASMRMATKRRGVVEIFDRRFGS